METSEVFDQVDLVNKSINIQMLDVEYIDQLMVESFPAHPFLLIPPHANYSVILSNYLAMSQAFPYLQSGSQKDLFFHYMKLNQDIPVDVELTTVVGNFLCWDETGGLYPTIAMGLKALPKILETNRFHSNILKADGETLLGKALLPDYSEMTQHYLKNLYDLLSAVCPLTRVACMVSFECHANRMIAELWENIAKKFNVSKKTLRYFAMHVGGSEPAEAHHVEMTNLLISKIVQPNDFYAFIDKLKTSYALHYQWCQSIVNLGLD